MDWHFVRRFQTVRPKKWFCQVVGLDSDMALKAEELRVEVRNAILGDLSRDSVRTGLLRTVRAKV